MVSVRRARQLRFDKVLREDIHALGPAPGMGHNCVARAHRVDYLPDAATFPAFDALPVRVRRALAYAVAGDWSPFDAVTLIETGGEDYAIRCLTKAEQTDMKLMKTPCWKAGVAPLKEPK